jgi:hemerythrin-like domain-containing protein
MKRHRALIPLSRDHHAGLLLATRLQQGKRALLRHWSHNPHWQAQHVVEFFDEHLTEHFKKEHILFPAVKPYLKEQSAIIDRLLDEHRRMTAMVDNLRKPTGADLPRQLVEFGKLLEDHIHREERDVFPLCEELVPEQEWEQIEHTLKVQQ